MNKLSVIKKWSILLLFLFLALAVACNSGSISGPSGVSSSGASGTTYEGQVASYAAAYGMSDEWVDWMLANRARYEATYYASSALPSTITVSFQYETPINYNPPWTDEAEHMNALAALAEAAYSGYNFNFVFGGNTGTSYANVTAGIATNNSYASGNNIGLFYETIFNHEFGHVMNLLHHYDSVADIGDGNHMPPGDTVCIMDRNSTTFCSACSTALGIQLGVSSAAVVAAMSEIASHYP